MLLKTDGTPNARRIGALISLRDHARRVLQSQNEGWPEANRDEARKELNRAYDLFASQYGPVNKTTFTTAKDGTVIRRMPNLAKFREDPDAMLVMSLEEYDEIDRQGGQSGDHDQGRGRPDAAGHARRHSAEEGLLVSLDRCGAVDLPLIANLYGKPEEQVVAELGDLIYRDPETRKSWQTADDYLSGNVRAKLASAIAAGAEYRAQRRGFAETRAARGRAAGRYRRQSRRAVDTRSFATSRRSPPSCSASPRIPSRSATSRKTPCGASRPITGPQQSVAATSEYGTPGPTAPGCSTWPST